jgi:hypothetical protein
MNTPAPGPPKPTLHRARRSVTPFIFSESRQCLHDRIADTLIALA